MKLSNKLKNTKVWDQNLRSPLRMSLISTSTIMASEDQAASPSLEFALNSDHTVPRVMADSGMINKKAISSTLFCRLTMLASMFTNGALQPVRYRQSSRQDGSG